MQTILNGNNYIIDYTEPNKGKIYGFIKDVDTEMFYKNRYINIQKKEHSIDFEYELDEKFCINEKLLSENMDIYVQKLLGLFL